MTLTIFAGGHGARHRPQRIFVSPGRASLAPKAYVIEHHTAYVRHCQSDSRHGGTLILRSDA